ncbi:MULTISPECIES: gliding motility lipoprotein GldH [unclassified Pedobacter]|uniref:gliding motility lipoprotein GldH n=1 Tax=Pedobacter TaxID=84567 RepID=UPI000B4B0D2A|nr:MULTISPECIES: gliding motility lipoprotein GldH [unclassified Pedobacter]MCX2432143.1 gliding motility lipoprotein GldH [Pedobacter sp. GR22-10]MCX2582690.1 gliding motility lipoprotein GldH [Pedobacter sp. MR22-3]OWK71455.1 gliding motility lipoprotein GldH [Pedobacter sp. AJM]
MVQKINLLLNKKQAYLLVFLLGASLFLGCTSSIIDSNVKVPERKWTYRNHIVNAFEIKDNAKPYNIYFKLRHTADYKYSNIFILAHFNTGKKVITRRYQYKLAKNDGEWLGSGSGNIFSYTLPMQTNFHFPTNGKFSIEIEQNMRDNPLLEVVDLGILVEESQN